MLVTYIFWIRLMHGGMEHVKVTVTLSNKSRFLLLAREVIGWNSDRKPVKPD